MTTIGIIHPGAMGAEVGARLVEAGRKVIWSSAGRSEATVARAEDAGLADVSTVAELVTAADVVLSVCPPDAAGNVARAVAAVGYDGIYVDANAVAPATARAIGAPFERYVDGGIVGPPPTAAGSTRLYLAGPDAQEVAGLFADTAVEARVVAGDAGAASAVKMCFAAWTKGTSALLLAIRALAEAEGVTESLLGEWRTSLPDLIERSERTATAVGPKAWRFAGEMEEIAATFGGAGLPDGFHLGAAELYRSLAPLKGRTGTVDLAEALELLLAADEGV
ncbi:MAG: DUF1932 domain-containing protein [Actinomycetota bacterium]